MAGIPWEYFNLISNGFLPKGEKEEQKVLEARQKYDAALADKILSHREKPELIVLAGWMYVFSVAFLEPIKNAGIKIINLHPAKPGTFKTHHPFKGANQSNICWQTGEFDGANAIERAYAELKAGRIKTTGIMAHYVIAEVDRGAPILVEEIEWNGEELAALEEKMHVREHDIIVKATDKVAREIVEGRS